MTKLKKLKVVEPIVTPTPKPEAADTVEIIVLSDEILVPADAPSPPVMIEEIVPVVVEVIPEVAPPAVLQDELNNNGVIASETVTEPETVTAPDETDKVAVAPPADSNNNNNNATPTVQPNAMSYSPDQWSPANLGGKRYYTREQLLKLKDLPAAVARPAIPDAVKTLLAKNQDILLGVLENKTFQKNNRSQMGGE